MAAPLTLLLIVAVTIRAVLFRSSLAELISARVEVVSPLNAWKRGMIMYFFCMGMLYGMFLYGCIAELSIEDMHEIFFQHMMFSCFIVCYIIVYLYI